MFFSKMKIKVSGKPGRLKPKGKCLKFSNSMFNTKYVLQSFCSLGKTHKICLFGPLSRPLSVLFYFVPHSQAGSTPPVIHQKRKMHPSESIVQQVNHQWLPLVGRLKSNKKVNELAQQFFPRPPIHQKRKIQPCQAADSPLNLKQENGKLKRKKQQMFFPFGKNKIQFLLFTFPNREAPI